MKCVCPKYDQRLVTLPAGRGTTVPVCRNCGRNPPDKKNTISPIFSPLPVYSMHNLTREAVDLMMVQYATECVSRALNELTETLKRKLS